MAKELASVSETVDLIPQEALDRAQTLLTAQGYNVNHNMFTSLTVERYVPNNAGEQERRTLTVIAQPQRRGGVRIKVVGNDAEGVRQHQAEWLKWSENLPKKVPDEPKAATAARRDLASKQEPTNVPSEPRQTSTREPAETPAESYRASASVPTTTAPKSKVAGGVKVLNRKLRRLVDRNISEGESIQFCLISPNLPGWTQAIVALGDRLLVIKPGMAAGSTFGARVTSFYYRDINGIEVNTGLINGVIEINTPSYQGTYQKDFWRGVRDRDNDPFKLTNCLPIAKRDLKAYKPYIDRLRTMIRESKQERVIQQPAPSGSSLGSELEKLDSLRASGVLTEEEFQKAKQRLLG